MLRSARLAATLCLLLLALAPLASAEPPDQTEHYDLHVRGLPPGRVGALAEALHKTLSAELGTAPAERLKVHVLPTSAEYVEAAVAASYEEWRQPISQSDGIYVYEDRAVYLWVTSGRTFLTVNSILHELTHQFYANARAGNRKPAGRYHEEGLANHFAEHVWDGRTLRATPPWEVQAYLPADALAAWLGPRGRNFESLATDPGEPALAGVAESWALVTFLRECERERFDEWSRRLDAGDDAVTAWREALAEIEDVDARYETWLRGVLDRHRWLHSSGRWHRDTATGAESAATADRSATAVFKDRPAERRVRVTRRGFGGTAGLIFNFASPEVYEFVTVDAYGRATGYDWADGVTAQTFRTDAGFVADAYDFEMSVEIGDDGVAVVAFDGREAARRPTRAGGREGYWVAGTHATFTPLGSSP